MICSFQVKSHKTFFRELAYFSLNDSASIWEVNVAHRWKMLPLELATWIENQWRQGKKQPRLEDYVVVREFFYFFSQAASNFWKIANINVPIVVPTTNLICNSGKFGRNASHKTVFRRTQKKLLSCNMDTLQTINSVSLFSLPNSQIPGMNSVFETYNPNLFTRFFKIINEICTYSFGEIGTLNFLNFWRSIKFNISKSLFSGLESWKFSVLSSWNLEARALLKSSELGSFARSFQSTNSYYFLKILHEFAKIYFHIF